MKLLLTISILLISLNVSAGLDSPFESSVEGIDINNTHFVDDDKQILRGQAPKKLIHQLVDFGVTDILIFKNQTRDEVDTEVAELERQGYSSSNIHQFDFKWKDIGSGRSACRKTIRSLKIIRNVKEAGGTIFFHCTVGEDRTGLLAGLWRILEQDWGRSEAFKKELCANGFASGNPHKPSKVVNEIRKGLTPLFFEMATLIHKGKITMDNLDENICDENITLRKSWSKCL